MDANHLNDKIEQLAKTKAAERVHSMKVAIEEACGKVAGRHNNDGAYFGKTFIEVCKAYVKGHESSSHVNLPVSQEIIDHYRRRILDEILTKVPLIKELNELVDE